MITIIQAITDKDGTHTIEIKNKGKYAIIRGKGHWLKILLKCLIKLFMKPSYYGK